MKKLLNNYSERGCDLSSFEAVVKEMEDRTKVLLRREEDVVFHCNTSDGVKDGILSCPADIMVSLGTFIGYDGANGMKNTVCSGWDSKLWDEAISKVAFFISTKEEGIMPASEAISGDWTRIGIGGEAAKKPSYHLLGLVSQQLEGTTITLCTRTAIDNNGKEIHKVFSVRSGSYMYVPQTEALEIAEEVCAGGDFVEYTINNFVTAASWKFPSKTTNITCGGKIVSWLPYIRFSTSDTGDASCAFELGWRCGGIEIFLASGDNSVSRKHVGQWNRVKGGFKKAALKIRDKLTILPEQMEKQDKVVVKSEKIKGVVMNLCDDSKVTSLGEGVTEAITNEVSEKLKDKPQYTAAEIILEIMRQQESLEIIKNLSDVQLIALKHRMGELPYQRIREDITGRKRKGVK